MAALAGAGLLVGVVISVLLGSALPAVGGLVVGGLIGAGVVVYGTRSASRLALAGVPVAPADVDGHARLHNLTEGLCVTVGVSKPELLVVDVDTANAASLAHGHTEGVLVVTTGLLDALERVELEGVLAHQLRRIRDHDALVATRAVPFAAPPAWAAPVLAARVAPLLGGVDEVFMDDRAAVDVTRYPPGLAAALGRLEERGTAVPGVTTRSAHLWLASPLPEGAPASPSLDDRIAALREL